MLRSSVRGRSNSLKLVYAPLTISGCTYSWSVSAGVNVTLSRVSICSVRSCRSANT